MKVNKKGFSLVEVLLGFVIITIVSSVCAYTWVFQFRALKITKQNTIDYHSASKYIQEEMNYVQNKIDAKAKKDKEDGEVNPVPDNDINGHQLKKFRLFVGTANEVETEYYVIETDQTGNPLDKDGNQRLGKYRPNYGLLISAINIPDLPPVEIGKITQWFDNIGDVGKPFSNQVNFYKEGESAKVKIEWEPTTETEGIKADGSKEKKYWYSSNANYIAPLYKGMIYNENEVGTIIPSFPDGYKKLEGPTGPTGSTGSETFTFNNDANTNKNVKYAIETLSNKGKLGNLTASDSTSFLIKYPDKQPYLHIDANYIIPTSYHKVDGTDDLLIDNVNVIDSIDKSVSRFAGKSGTITFATPEKTGSKVITDAAGKSLNKNVYVRAFNFKDSDSGIVQNNINYNPLGISFFVVAKVKDEPSNNIPIVAFENASNSYKFKLYSSKLMVRNISNVPAGNEEIPFSIMAKKDEYVLYSFQIKNGKVDMYINNKEINNTNVGSSQNFTGSITVAKFLGGDPGNEKVNVVELQLYNNNLDSTGFVKTRNELIAKYGLREIN